MSDQLTIERLTEELETCRKRAAGILETAVNAIIIIDDRGVIETVNEAATRLFGYTRDEMLGQKINMLMPNPYRDQHDRYMQNYYETGVRKIIGIGREAVGRRKDGTLFPIDLSVGEVQLSTGRIFTGIIRDLTERKRLEEKLLSISEEEQARIGRDIHDDLCQQLAAIGCLARVVYQRLTNSNTPEALQMAEITRLITTANARAREMSRGLMPVTLDSQGLMAALAELAASTERIFRVSCPFHCEQEVELPDNKLAVQLYRIAQEAVANAIKHSKADLIEITLNRRNGHVRLTVADNGVGIPDNVSGQSTGMGLLTMSHRARGIGGTLSVESRPHGGAIVTCEVPLPQ